MNFFFDELICWRKTNSRRKQGTLTSAEENALKPQAPAKYYTQTTPF